MIDQERAVRAFTLISPDFLDNGLLPERSAYDRAGCHGQNAACIRTLLFRTDDLSSQHKPGGSA